MQTDQRNRTKFRQSDVVRLVIKTSILTFFGLLFLGIVPGLSSITATAGEVQAHPNNTCAGNGHTSGTHHRTNHTHAAVRGHQHSKSAARFNAIQTALASGHASNHTTNSRQAHPTHTHCLASYVRVSRASRRYIQVSRQGNVFPYGQCTWYADQRFHQLHGVYVPWASSANAWQWSTRASEYGWRVSRRPIPGSIIVLQGGVQGASWAGHVGIVERINHNGSVIVSSMNWGANRFAVSQWRFYPGPGVVFVGM